MQHSEIVSFLWSVADLIRDSVRRSKYQDVILPLTVLRRIDGVLAATRPRVLETYAKYQGKLDNLDPLLRKASGYAFYNTSPYDFERLAGDAPNVAANLRHYIAGFSPNMREVLEKYDFDNTITKLTEAGLLFQVVERFRNVDLRPARVPNHVMGTIFEELIRKFNEALNENPGEHFTPRDVVHLMVDLLLAGDAERVARPNAIVTVYDPCCGSGGMLTIAKDHLLGTADRPGLAPGADVHLFGQEINPETYAVCKSDLFIKSADGRDAERIAFGSTLSRDGHAGQRFDYVIANPPYGMDWKRDQDAVKAEHERGEAGRFAVGLPRISDGQLLFLQHMMAHMTRPEEGGARVAIIMNGSPLFTGDAGSGESEIRRWVLEHDLLEAIVALPEQLFYNTGIATYVWVLTNRKRAGRKGKVLLVNATSFWTPMRPSLGDKRREVPAERAAEIVRLVEAFEETEVSKVFPTTHFGYRKITVERPLRLAFEATPERLARLEEQGAFRALATSRRRDPAARAAEEAEGRAAQAAVRAVVASLAGTRWTDREAFLAALRAAARRAGVRLAAPVVKAVVAALGERDPEAPPCVDRDGHPEPDPELRDTESVPLGEPVEDYAAREVLPYVPDAWVSAGVRDHRDGGVGKVGYEINFNRYFYQYVPPRPLAEIEADIRTIEREIVEMLGGVGA